MFHNIDFSKYTQDKSYRDQISYDLYHNPKFLGNMSKREKVVVKVPYRYTGRLERIKQGIDSLAAGYCQRFGSKDPAEHPHLLERKFLCRNSYEFEQAANYCKKLNQNRAEQLKLQWKIQQDTSGAQHTNVDFVRNNVCDYCEERALTLAKEGRDLEDAGYRTDENQPMLVKQVRSVKPVQFLVVRNRSTSKVDNNKYE